MSTHHPSSHRNRWHYGFLLTLILSLLVPSASWASDIDQDGGIELTVSFEIDPGLEASALAPVSDPLAQQHYCDSIQEFSRDLYATTEGAHWIRRVRFFEQANFRDFRWHYLVDSNSFSYGNFRNYILVREKGTSSPNPYDPPPGSTEGMGWLLNHEFGHYFYNLPDEYINSSGTSEKRTGFCGDGSYNIMTEEDGDQIGNGTTCDEEGFDCGGSPCVYFGQCIQGGAGLGTACSIDSDCGGGGTGRCLGGNENRADKPAKKRICLNDTELSIDAGDPQLGVCLMAGGGQRDRWCDGGKNPQGELRDGASHAYTFENMPDYGVDVEFDLGGGVGAPDGASGYDWVAHNCWDRAMQVHTDLANVHELEVYPTFFDIEADEGPVPAVQCEWLIDGLGSGSHAALLIDRSGSMSYQDLSDPPVAAVDLAMDGALYFYNRTDDGDWAGVSVYNTGTSVATSGGASLDFAAKGGNIDGIDGVNAGGKTDIAQAIDSAVVAINAAAGLPLANRNIVLFSDGRSNEGSNPVAAAEAACEAGINVHTIAYGDADSSALEQIAACGMSWVAGTEDSTGVGFSEPDPLEIKTAVARMRHAIQGEDELLEYRGDLESLAVSTVEKQSFHVPEGTPGLTFSWLGNRTCVYGKDTQTCDPVLNLVRAAELVAPSGTIFSAGPTPEALDGVYRTVTVVNPESGDWTARLDKSQPPIQFVIPNEWPTQVPKTRVSWIGFVSHPGLEGLAWVPERRLAIDHPVTIQAQMFFGMPATDVTMVATVTHAGSSWTVPLFDDGQHKDDFAGDGTYGGVFNPDGLWPGVTEGNYRVKVRMSSVEGKARALPASDAAEEIEPQPVPAVGTATLEVETSFRLADSSGQIYFQCPPLVRGQTTAVAGQVWGFGLPDNDTRFALGGDVEISNLSTSCLSCPDISTDLVSHFSFDATADTDAALGFRPLRVQVGTEIVESSGTCRVCASPQCSEIELEQDSFVAGQSTDLTVTGALPGEAVEFFLTRRGLGSGPCPANLGGLCLDLAPQVTSLGTALADSSGKAVLNVAAPAVAPGKTLSTQAVVSRGVGGANSVKSNTVEKRLLP